MSYSTLPHDVRTIAERVLSQKQLEAFHLEVDGLGTMAIARRLLLTRSAVKDRLHNAHTALIKAGVRQNGNGDWYVEEAA
jgi:DNA-binding NarL/FixJ family response regulator